MQKNKWRLETKDSYIIGDQEFSRTNSIAIPPTSGDRVDIIDSLGHYHYNTSISEFKNKFMDKLTPEEYIDKTSPGLSETERKRAIRNIDWTPIKSDITIVVIIDIKQGEITLKHK
jgi:hypothetical protein